MNILPAIINSVISSEHLSSICVLVNNDEFHLFLVETLDETEILGTKVTLAFKETEVILLKETVNSSANIQTAIIKKIEEGKVLTQVTLTYGPLDIISLVSTLTFNLLDVHEGDTIAWMVQPSEISLLRSHHGV